MLSNKSTSVSSNGRSILLCALLLCLAFAQTDTAQAGSDRHHSVQELIARGHADEAIAALLPLIAADPQNATAHNLLCRVQYQEERWPEAIRECETAVHLQPGNSEFHDWLGRADGQQAQRVSMFSAFGLARKVRAEFQTAVQLDPRNVAALCDLGEFDVEAPGFLGGGLDRAASIAQQLQPLNAEKYHELLARVAMKKKDIPSAERELKFSVAQAKAPAAAWMRLAGFYARRQNFPAMEQSIQSGMAADPGKGIAWVEGASILIHYKQNLPLAERMLRAYLASPNQSEDAPAFQVQVTLAHLLASQGNKAAALQEDAAAQALASDYAAARHFQ